MVDKKIVKEKVLGFAGMIFKHDQEKLNTFKQFIEECGAFEEDDRCDVAGKFGECMKMAFQKFGIGRHH